MNQPVIEAENQKRSAAFAAVTGSATGLRQWLEKEQSNAYWRAKVKSAEGDVTGAQWWRGNGAMAKRVLAWLDAQSPNS